MTENRSDRRHPRLVRPLEGFDRSAGRHLSSKRDKEMFRAYVTLSSVCLRECIKRKISNLEWKFFKKISLYKCHLVTINFNFFFTKNRRRTVKIIDPASKKNYDFTIDASNTSFAVRIIPYRSFLSALTNSRVNVSVDPKIKQNMSDN